MTYLVTENCIKCTYMDCIEVCPVEHVAQGHAAADQWNVAGKAPAFGREHHRN